MFSFSVSAQEETLGKVKLVFKLDEQGEPVYSVTYGDRAVILPSKMGFRLLEADSAFTEGFVETGVERREVDTTWEPVWGETKYIRDHHREMRVHLRQTGSRQTGGGAGSGRLLDLVFRVYEDGVGFRYEFPRQAGSEIFRCVR